jgi:anti-sigma factor RsiW
VRPLDPASECGWFQGLAAEFALGLVTGHERSKALAHLQGCPACCRHIASMAVVCDRLRGLIPSIEAPVGFEQRVLQRRAAAEAPGRVGMSRRVRATAGAVLMAAGFAGGWLAQSATRAPPRPTAGAVASPLMAGTRHVGDLVVNVDGPQFVSVYLIQPPPSRLTCQLLRSDGSVAATETYDASGDVGSWDITRPEADVTTIRISDAAGDILGAGTLPRP